MTDLEKEVLNGLKEGLAFVEPFDKDERNIIGELKDGNIIQIRDLDTKEMVEFTFNFTSSQSQECYLMKKGTDNNYKSARNGFAVYVRQGTKDQLPIGYALFDSVEHLEEVIDKGLYYIG